MTRRAKVVLWTSAVLLTLFAVAVLGVLGVTQTARGRAEIRSLVVTAIRSKVHGSLYVGKITDGFFTGLTIDSLAIRDSDDSLFVSTGPISLRYDLRDLIDRRVLLRGVRVEHPIVYIRQHENGDWNFRRVFPPSKPDRFQPKQTGAFIVIDSAIVRDASFMLTLPWHVSPTLRGVARDSAIRYELSRHDIDIRRSREGYTRTWRWSHGNVSVLHGRVSHPDTAGMAFTFANTGVTETDPPFVFSNVSGTMRQLGDSIWVDFPHFDLPASAGRGAGKIVWGSDLPVRYDIHVHGDSVSMSDVAWVYATLPHTGGGKTDLDIKTDLHNMRLTNFILTSMDVRSTRSRLLGRMTFVTGADTLSVKDVQLAAQPVNFDLLRTLNGKPFPYDWQGDITGTIKASGGNLGRFRVDDAQLRFADANVPGAYGQVSGNGELDIFLPAFTAFHGFNVNVATFDLRTLQFLNKEFPRLNGTISGTAVLDSSWLDVRFRNAQLTHRDGDGPESHVSGNGRVTWGEKYLTYDLDMQAAPVAFETIRKSYPLLPLRASLSGPIRVLGQSPDLALNLNLSGDAGSLAFDGRVDADPPVYGVHGGGAVTAANVRALVGNTTLPQTSLNGNYTLDITGDSLANFVGGATVNVAESEVSGTRLQSSAARLRFTNGLVTFDTLSARVGDVSAHATGTVALAPGQTGSLAFTADVPSFGELEKLLGMTPSASLVGGGTFNGTLSGPSNALALAGSGATRALSFGSAHIGVARLDYALHDLARAGGTVKLTADSVVAGAVPVNSATVDLTLANGNSAAFRADFGGAGNSRGTIQGSALRDSSGRVDVALDSAAVFVDTLNSYFLAAPARLAATGKEITLDSLLLQRRGGGSIALRRVSVMGDSVRASLRTEGLNLAFLELFGSGVRDLHGGVAANVDLSGTTTAPRLNGTVAIDGAGATIPAIGLRLDRLDGDIGLTGDSIIVRKLTATTVRDRTGTVDVSGSIAFADLANPTFALQANARSFRPIDRRGLATLDVTTTSPITLTGPYRGAVVGGSISVDRGTVYIPEVVRKRVVDLNDPELLDVIDTTVASNRAILPSAPSEFTTNLSLNNVAINIGDDVWLRSDEANIKLGGSLNVTLGRNPLTGERSQLALEGQLNAVRGTYRLNVVPFVQPTFDVEQGTLRFFGTPDLDPALDITAINTVRRPRESVNGQDVRIRATIGGTLSAPSLSLSSADNLPLSQSDMLSYLITGEPAFTLDYTTQQYVNQLANVAVRSAGNIITSAIPRSVFDVVELQTPNALTPDQAQATAENATFYDNLLNTRAVVGKQLNNNLFLNFSTGFCAENFRNNLGLRLEYRFGRTYSAQFGVEPGSSDLVCARAGAVQSIQQTPPQIGADFLRAWRF